MAGGDTHRFDYSTIVQSGRCNLSFLGVPHACEDDVYKGFFNPKAPFRFQVVLPFFLSLIISSFGPNRIHGTSS
jgi:hypothetical protein